MVDRKFERARMTAPARRARSLPVLTLADRTRLTELTLGRVAESLEAVEDQVEDKLERALALAAEPREVLLDMLGDVLVLVGGELAEEGRRQVSNVVPGDREAGFAKPGAAAP